MYEPFGHAAHAVRTGDFLWISGQGPFDADGALVGAGDIAQQARQTLANMERVLGAAGMDFEDVAKVVVYLANPDDHALINPVRKEFFGPHMPVSTLFGVHSLPAGIGIEIEAVAYKPSAGAPPREEINVPIQDPPLSHYTDGVRCGDLLFLSGQGPFDVSFNLAGGDDVAAQAVKVHENLGAVLAAAGMGFEDMAKVTVYLSDVAERPLINPVRRTLLWRAQTGQHPVRRRPAGAPSHAYRNRRHRLPAALTDRPRGYSAIVMPPSTTMTWPLMKAEAGAARKTAMPSRSSGRPQRASGVRPRMRASKSESLCNPTVMSVAK